MADPENREATWRPAPGERVRLRMPLDRPRALDGQTGTVRYCWPGAADGYPWLIALDRPAIDGRRAYTLVLCASVELEPADDARRGERRGMFRVLPPGARFLQRQVTAGGTADDRTTPAEAYGHAQVGRLSSTASVARFAASAHRAAPEVITYRWQSEFVGRARATDEFAENLTLSLDDERRRLIYNVFGPSGAGKTWLLRRFDELFRRSGGIVLWSDDSDEDLVGVMERIAGQLADQGWSLPTIQDALRRYRESDRERYATGGPVNLSVSTPYGRIRDGRAELASSPLALNAGMSQDANTIALDQALAEMDWRVARAADPRPLRAALREITPLFVEGLRRVASERPVALFFDGYERSGPYLDAWLNSILAGEHGDLPGSTIVVVAGRSPLVAARLDTFDSVTARVALGPWSEEETRAFLLHHWILDERVVRTIQQVSGRLPVLVATMAIRASDQLDRLVQPDRNALDCFLTSLGDPVRHAVAVDASVPRRLDVDVLARVIEEPDHGPLIDWLRKMPFVEQRGSAWTFRTAVRDVLLRHLRAESPGRWLDLHDRLASYYERLADALDADEPSRLRDVTAQAYETEALYHRLCQNPPGYLASALNGFVDRFGGETMLVRRWGEAIRQAGHDAADGTTERWGDRLVEVADAFANGRYEIAARAFGALLASDQLEPRSRRAALAWRARLLVGAGRFDLALAAYDLIVEEVRGEGIYWAERAHTLLRLGRHRDALSSLDRGLEIDPDSPRLTRLRVDVERLAEILDGGPDNAQGDAEIATGAIVDQGNAATVAPDSERSSAEIVRRAATATR